MSYEAIKAKCAHLHPAALELGLIQEMAADGMRRIGSDEGVSVEAPIMALTLLIAGNALQLKCPLPDIAAVVSVIRSQDGAQHFH